MRVTKLMLAVALAALVAISGPWGEQVDRSHKDDNETRSGSTPRLMC